MPEETLDIVVRAKDQASAALQNVQQGIQGVKQAAVSATDAVRAQQIKTLQGALADPTGLSRKTRQMAEETLHHLGALVPKALPAPKIPAIKMPVLPPLKPPEFKPPTIRAPRIQPLDMRPVTQPLANFQPHVARINLLGAGILALQGPLGVVAGLFQGLGSVAGNVLRSIISGVMRLAQAILSLALDALHKLTLAFGAAAAAAAALVAVVLKLGFSYIGFANEQKNALTVMLGSRRAAEGLYNWMEKLAGSLRIDPRPLIEAGRKMVAFGINVKQTLPWALDLAAAMKEPIAGVAEMLGRVEMEQALMRSLAGMGIGKKRLMEVGVQFKGEQIVNRAQLMAGLKAIVTRDFPNMAAQGRSELARIWQQIKTNITEAAAEISAGPYRVLQGAGDKLLTSWENLRKSDAWTRIKDRAGGALAWIAQQITALIGGAPQLLSWFARIFDAAPIEEFLGMIKGVADFLRGELPKAAQRAGAIISGHMRASGIDTSNVWQAVGTFIVKAIAGAEAGLFAFAEEWPKVFAWIKRIASDFVASLRATFDTLLIFFDDLGSSIAEIHALILRIAGAINITSTAAIALYKIRNPLQFGGVRVFKEVTADIREAIATNARWTKEAGALWRGGYKERRRMEQRPPAEKAYEEYVARPQYDARRAEQLYQAMIRESKAKRKDDEGIAPWTAVTTTVAAAVAAFKATKFVMPRVQLPPPIQPERIEDAARGGTHTGVVEGMASIADDFVTKVWGASAEMLKRAGVSPMWLESIGVHTGARALLPAPAALPGAQPATGAQALMPVGAKKAEALPGAQALLPVGGVPPAEPPSFAERIWRGMSTMFPAAPRLAPAAAGAGPPIHVNLGGLTVNSQADLAGALKSPAAKRDFERALESFLGDWLRRYR